MKTIALIATGLLFAAAGPAAPALRFEAEGVRVGAELVSGAALVMKGGAAPVLVSGNLVESLGAPVAVSVAADRAVTLDAGVRLARAGEGWTLSSHGPDLALEVGGRTLDASRSISFRTTEKGFDLGALGTIEAVALTAKVAAPKAPAVAPVVAAAQQDPTSPERARREGARTLKLTLVFGFGDPTTMHAAAEKYNLAGLQNPPAVSP
jgi:hypothetical protein